MPSTPELLASLDGLEMSRESVETSATDVRGTREVTGRGISRASVAAEALRRRATTPASVSAAAAALRRRTGSRGSIAAAALRRLGS